MNSTNIEGEEKKYPKNYTQIEEIIHKMIWPGISGYFCLSVCQCPSKQNLKSQSKLKNLIFIFKSLGSPLMKIVKSKNFFVLISYVFCIISFVLKRLYVNKQSFF